MAAHRFSRSPSRSVLAAPRGGDCGGVSGGASASTSAAGDPPPDAACTAPAAATASAASLAGGPPLSGLGCTCGAGDSLEAERLRLNSHCRSISERTELLGVREEELQRRGELVQASTQSLAESERAFQDRRASAAARLAEAEQRLREVVDRDEVMQRTEADLRQEEEQLAQLEAEASRGEAGAADEELVLLEARNAVEAELERLRGERASLQAQASSLDQQLDACGQGLRKAQRDKAALLCDVALLGEIESQVAPIRRALEGRERPLAAGEGEAGAREADCEEREAHLLPEYTCGVETLAVAEERARELAAREEESERHRSRLLQRQRDLGGAEIRLSGLEGALRQQRPPPAGEDESDLRRRLGKLRAADAGWSEKVRAQQAAVQLLEARAAELEACSTAAEPRASASRLSAKLGHGAAGLTTWQGAAVS